MGAEPYLLASSMTAVLAQRVVRKIHEDCKEEYAPDPKVIADMKTVLGPLWSKNKDEKEIKLYRGHGDPECNSSGYYGRVGIFEIMPISPRISRLILEQKVSSGNRKSRSRRGNDHNETGRLS